MYVPRPRGKGGEKLPFDFTGMKLKPDHENRPFWVLPNGVILLEAFSRFYEQVRRGQEEANAAGAAVFVCLCTGP